MISPVGNPGPPRVSVLEGPDNSTFEFGPLDRIHEGAGFMCSRGALESNVSILVVFCEYCLHT